MKVLGLDFGSKNIGVAISDFNKKIALPLTTVPAQPVGESVRLIESVIYENEVDSIVVGLPKTLRGELSHQAKLTLEFAKRLENDIKKPVIMQDERLTSKQAEKMIGNLTTKDRENGLTDKIAAAIILQAYLDSIK